MLITWQALAFTACVLVGLLPSTEVDCRFNAPVVEISPPPPPVRASQPVEPAEPPAADAPGVVTATQKDPS